MIRRVAFLLVVFVSTVLAQAAAPGYTKLNTSLVTSATFTDSSCPNQSSCYYQLTAVDAQNFESVPAACDPSQLCVGGNQAVVVMPSSGTHTVTVKWIASTSAVTGYNVYRHIGPLAASGLSTTVN